VDFLGDVVNPWTAPPHILTRADQYKGIQVCQNNFVRVDPF